MATLGRGSNAIAQIAQSEANSDVASLCALLAKAASPSLAMGGAATCPALLPLASVSSTITRGFGFGGFGLIGVVHGDGRYTPPVRVTFRGLVQVDSLAIILTAHFIAAAKIDGLSLSRVIEMTQ